MKEVMIVGATRTPIGSFRGALSPFQRLSWALSRYVACLKRASFPQVKLTNSYLVRC
jgi:hypothetical protein